MKNNKGFIELVSVKDYWGKLQFDYTELKKNRESVYVAFNFFVTSYHLLDWIFFKDEKRDERTRLNNKPILKICNHIANGIKHFKTKDKRHNSIKKIEKERFAEEDYWEEDYAESPIIIYLEDKLVSEFGESIEIIELAGKVMQFWEGELSKRKLI